MGTFPQRYAVYGITLWTKDDLDSLLVPSGGSADVEYVVCKDEQPDVWDNSEIICESVSVDPDGVPPFIMWRRSEHHRIQLTNVATYDLMPESIVCYPYKNVPNETLNNSLLGEVLSLWLELQGIIALHASALVIDDHAMGLLSHSGNGKSTLAATLVQSGYPLLTDDIIPIENRGGAFISRPGFPQMRLWPDEAEHFVGHFQDLPKVNPTMPKRWVQVGSDGFGTFCDLPRPLKCLYLLARRESVEGGSKIEILPVSKRDAVIELVRYSFFAPIFEAIGLQRQRLALFAQMVQQVPVRRLLYPSGFEYLPKVRDAILRDLAGF